LGVEERKMAARLRDQDSSYRKISSAQMKKLVKIGKSTAKPTDELRKLMSLSAKTVKK